MQDLNTLRDAVQRSPHDLRLWLLYAHSCVSRSDFAAAGEAFDHALELAPLEPEALLGLAQVRYNQGRLSEAAIRTQLVVEQHPQFAPAHILLARIHLREGNPHEAAENYRQGVALSKVVIDPAIESDLAANGYSTGSLGQLRSGQERSRLAAPASWETGEESPGLAPDGFEADFPPVDAEGLEQSEFGFVEEEEFQFDLDEYERPKSSFADVAGLEDVKDELMIKLVQPYEHQELFRAYGKRPGGSVLLYGPPGCGKSLLCRSLAGECNAKFYTLKLHEIMEMYIGCSEKNLHSFFANARQNAPAVIFIDELDALGGDRNDLRQSPARGVVNQLLLELDGFDGANEGLLIVGATSAIWNVDQALLRPGRFDRCIHVPPPDASTREAILKLQAQSRPVVDLDFTGLSEKLEHYSGADIAQVFDVAAEDALRLAIRKKVVVPLTNQALEAAIGRVPPSLARWKDHDPHSRRSG